MRRLAPSAVAALAALTALPAAAAANATQESHFQDDALLLYESSSRVEATMRQLRSLGVDRVRVSVLWRLVAPRPEATTRPAFDATDPGDYPSRAWDRYDRVVLAAGRNGLALHFAVTGTAPLWATRNPAAGEPMLDPKPDEYRAFVTAVGRRYSGSLRVSFWSGWNEPNQPGWLRPQGGRRPVSPHLYRALQDAAWQGLRASGHGRDTYVLGETAPRGTRRPRRVSPMRPLLFIRELYCVDRRLRPFRGRSARVRGCPASRAARRRFVARHPGLFRARGWAHHPYALEAPPARPDPLRDQVTIATLRRLTRTLDRIHRRWRVRRRMPIYLTEYGYQTDPPDPVIGVSWRRQAAWINEGEHIAYRNRRVRSTSQFLLIDDLPDATYPPSSPRYWGATFQSGLMTAQGQRKPSFLSYQRGVDVTPKRTRRGRRLRVFGFLRPAPPRARLSARVEFRRRGSRRWRRVRRVRTRSLRNYLSTRLRASRSGHYRLRWRNPSGGSALATRSVFVKVLPPRSRRRR